MNDREHHRSGVNQVSPSRLRLVPGLSITSGEPELFVAKGANGTLEVGENAWSVATKCGLPFVLDEEALVDTLARPLYPADYTRSLLAGVQRIPTWASAELLEGTLKITDAAQPAEVSPASIDETIERLEDTLTLIISESVKGRKHPAVLCSGGLDSAVVAALTARVLGCSPTLVTITGSGILSPAEMPLIEAVVKFLKARWITIDKKIAFELGDLYAENRGKSWPAGGVFSTGWRVTADTALEHGIDLLLSGEGAMRFVLLTGQKH